MRARVLYEFALWTEARPLLEGRASIVIDPRSPHRSCTGSPREQPAPRARHRRQRRHRRGASAGAWRATATTSTCMPTAAAKSPQRAGRRDPRRRRQRRKPGRASTSPTRAATRAALETVLESGPIQILVNNAGLHDDAVLPGMSAQQWHRVIDVSLNGFFNVTQPLLLPMIRTRWGRIVNVSSVAALIGNSRPGQLRRRQGRAALGHQGARAGGRQPRHHRERGRAGHHRHADDGRSASMPRPSSGWCR